MKIATLVIAFVFSSLVIAADPPTMTPEMEAMMKYAVPGEKQKLLAQLAGNWTYTSQWWKDAKSKPESSKGTTSSKMILGGRILQEDVKGVAGGQKFEGIALWAYDNFKGEFQNTWMDNMGTGIIYGSGSGDKNTITTVGSFACPMTNDKDRAFRNELKIKSKNEHTFTMYMKDESGKEFKSMEMVYTRAR